MNPQMFPTGQYMQHISCSTNKCIPIQQMQQMAALQYNATLRQPENGAFVMPHVPLSIAQLDQRQAFSASQHQDRAHRSGRGRHKTAASNRNHDLLASFGTITNDPIHHLTPQAGGRR